MLTDTHFNIFELPELEVLKTIELELAVKFWTIQRREALAHVAAAWDMYSQAIDDCDPQESIKQLGNVAEIMEAAALYAYRKLDEAKAALLARMN